MYLNLYHCFFFRFLSKRFYRSFLNHFLYILPLLLTFTSFSSLLFLSGVSVKIEDDNYRFLQTMFFLRPIFENDNITRIPDVISIETIDAKNGEDEGGLKLSCDTVIALRFLKLVAKMH